MFHQVFICDTGQNPQDAELESEAGPSSQEPQALDSSMKEEPESMAMETDTGSMPDEVDPNENEELKGKFDAEEKGIIHNLVPIAPPDEDSKVARKKASLKGPRSLFGKKNKEGNLKRAIEIIIGSTYKDKQQSKAPLNQQTTKSKKGFTKKPNQAKSNIITPANKSASSGKPTTNVFKENKSTRKDQENFVYIFILNGQKGLADDNTKRSGGSAMDVIDLSFVLNKHCALFDNFAGKNHKCTPVDVKKLVGKVLGELSKKVSAPHSDSMETSKKGNQYFLVLNCPIPSNIAELSKSIPPKYKTSNKKADLKPTKTKMLRSQPANTKRNLFPKGAVHKFKGGLTKRYLSDNGSKEGTANHEINQNDMESDDNDDYADNNSADFDANSGSDDEIKLPTVNSNPEFKKLRKAFTNIINKSQENMEKEASGLTKAEESKKQFHCERCVKSFNTMKLLKTHQKRKSCTNREEIELKKKEIILKKSKKSSKDEATDARNKKSILLNCDTCKSTFKNKRTLTQHIKTVCNSKETLGGGELICEQCGKVCRNRSYLLEHIACHENLRTFTCDLCGKGFNRKGFLSKHKRTVHGKQKYQYFCSHCGLKSESKEHIEKHEQVHTLPEGVPVPTPFQCECGKAFISKHELRNHKYTSCKQIQRPRAMRNMSGKRNPAKKPTVPDITPVACPICKKVCRNRMAMHMHKYNSHRKDGGQGWSCGPCGKTFTSRGGLTSHNIRHHRMSHVWCGLCQKEFKDRSTLWGHQKYVHAEGSPHRCGECGSKFKRKGDYVRHLKDRHGGARPPPPVPDPPAPEPMPTYTAAPSIETYFSGFL